MIDPQEHIDAIGTAADFVRSNAEELRCCHTLFSNPDDWTDNNDAKALYQLEIAAADDANDAAKAFSALQTERDALLQSLLALIDEPQPLGINRPAYLAAVRLIVEIEDREDVCLSD